MSRASKETRTRVVIVGRPNVGKSTLFNRLVGARKALVHDRPGVTRDRIVEPVSWVVHGKTYALDLVDTGGLGGEQFEEEIASQVAQALEGAAAILWVVDSREGLTDDDRAVITRLRRAKITQQSVTIAVANKVDEESLTSSIGEFFSTGVDEVMPVSAEHNRGIDFLKERVVELAELEPIASEEEFLEPQRNLDELPKIAVVGRPNVGKSTLVNALLREERMITSPIAGTTSDSVNSVIQLDGRNFLFIDTAGIRRKSKTEKGIEVLSVVQTKKSLERADIAILVLDGESGIIDQDEKIGGLIEEAGCSVILAMNKWDTQSKTGFSRDEAAERIRNQIRFLKYSPIVFMSALKSKGLDGLGDLIEEILQQRSVKLQTKEFSDWVRKESEIHNPMNVKFYLCHQTGRHPPTFSCHVSDPKKITFSLSRHLVNAMREKWGYMGTPIRLKFTKAEGKAGRRPTQ